MLKNFVNFCSWYSLYLDGNIHHLASEFVLLLIFVDISLYNCLIKLKVGHKVFNLLQSFIVKKNYYKFYTVSFLYIIKTFKMYLIMFKSINFNMNTTGRLKNIKVVFQLSPHIVQHCGCHIRHSICNPNIDILNRSTKYFLFYVTPKGKIYRSNIGRTCVGPSFPVHL